MKYLIISFLFISMISCRTAEQVSEVSAEQTAVDDRMSGIVRVSYKGCSPIIEATENGELVKFYPVNLSDKMKVDGMKIKFTYIPSRAQQPETCTFQLKVISIENAEIVK
jgi:hypothetical protein